MATHSIRDLGRREILMMSAVLAGSSGVVFSPKLAAAEAALQRTPDQILGPFYPLSELPQTSDLTRVSGRSGRAEGQVINVMGRVLNLAGQPVREAKVEGRRARVQDNTTSWISTSPTQAECSNRRPCGSSSLGRPSSPSFPRSKAGLFLSVG
jgi:protocatechuate 3,4-dioxygenase beta subunit